VHAQLPTTDAKEKKTEVTNNFLDLQANTYGDIFGNMLQIEEFKGIDDFMSLVNKMDATPEMKAKLKEQYQFYNNSLDPEKKELAKAQYNELLLKAIQEGQTKDKQNP
jgi:ubiquinone biosynthesis protein Coq4